MSDARRSFRQLPSDIKKTWFCRDMALVTEPSSSAAAEIAYLSPLKEVSLQVRFMSTDEIDNLPYVIDDSTFIPEWNFAESAWNELTDGITSLITAYNKELIKRARDKKLTNVRVLGRSRTEHGLIEAQQRAETEAKEYPDPLIDRQVQTLYEPSTRSTKTARSKITPMQAWMAGMPYKPKVK
jgi:hypothetical protein